MNDKTDWQELSPTEKRQRLFNEQKSLLDTFLETGSITEAEYEYSLSGLKEKMGLTDNG